MIAIRSCCRFVGCTSMMWISRSTTSQRCSIGLRSGDCGGHLIHSEDRVKIWHKVHESMDPSCLVSTFQAGDGGVMVWGIVSCHTLGPLVPTEHRLNATVYLSIVADHVHPFMTTVFPSSDGYFQQDNAPCHKAQIISDWFLEHDNEFTLLKWPPQSPDLNPIEHLLDVVEREIHIMDVQPTNLQQLRDAIMSIWTKISEKCLQHLIESMPRIIKAVQEVSVCVYIYSGYGKYSDPLTFFTLCYIAAIC